MNESDTAVASSQYKIISYESNSALNSVTSNINSHCLIYVSEADNSIAFS